MSSTLNGVMSARCQEVFPCLQSKHVRTVYQKSSIMICIGVIENIFFVHVPVALLSWYAIGICMILTVCLMPNQNCAMATSLLCTRRPGAGGTVLRKHILAEIGAWEIRSKKVSASILTNMVVKLGDMTIVYLFVCYCCWGFCSFQ